ncbi:TlpA family protein disulfide reductase [Salibacterium sp. K-3]
MKRTLTLPRFTGDEIWLNESWTNREGTDGHPIFVHFWSLSCSHCANAMPSLNRLLHHYRSTLDILSVHMPRSAKDKDVNKVKQKAAALGVTHALLVDQDRKVSDAFRNEYVPSYYLFRPDGVLFHTQSGDSGIRLLKKKIDRLLNTSW